MLVSSVYFQSYIKCPLSCSIVSAVSQHRSVSPSQDTHGDEATDTDSDLLSLEDEAGAEISNQLPVPDSAVMTTPGT